MRYWMNDRYDSGRVKRVKKPESPAPGREERGEFQVPVPYTIGINRPDVAKIVYKRRGHEAWDSSRRSVVTVYMGARIERLTVEPENLENILRVFARRMHNVERIVIENEEAIPRSHKSETVVASLYE